MVLMPRFDARAYLQAVHDHRVNVITGVPTMLSLMLKEQDLVNSLDFASVAGHLGRLGAAFGDPDPSSRCAACSPTRRSPTVTGTTEAGAGMFGGHPDHVPVPPASLGYPQAHVDVRLVGGR